MIDDKSSEANPPRDKAVPELLLRAVDLFIKTLSSGRG
ncbi:unnamed protein product, partial [Allacma fusca]